MRRLRLPGLMMLLVAASVVLYATVVPFPPWVAHTQPCSVLVLLVSYASGAALQIMSAAASFRHRLSIVLHRGARAVFFFGGVAVYLLHGRPDELASLWALFFIASRLRPRSDASSLQGLAS